MTTNAIPTATEFDTLPGSLQDEIARLTLQTVAQAKSVRGFDTVEAIAFVARETGQDTSEGVAFALSLLERAVKVCERNARRRAR